MMVMKMMIRTIAQMRYAKTNTSTVSQECASTRDLLKITADKLVEFVETVWTNTITVTTISASLRNFLENIVKVLVVCVRMRRKRGRRRRRKRRGVEMD
jgi:hypothetical protein